MIFKPGKSGKHVRSDGSPGERGDRAAEDCAPGSRAWGDRGPDAELEPLWTECCEGGGEDARSLETVLVMCPSFQGAKQSLRTTDG